MYDVECPYCGEDLDICHDDGQGYDEDCTHEQECPDCNKSFVFTVSIHFTYDAAKADCLNGAPHKFKHTYTAPIECTEWQCSDCDCRKPMSKEELDRHIKSRR